MFSNIQFLDLENSFKRSIFTFSASLMNFFHSIHRITYATASPIERCSTYIPCLSLPLAIYYFTKSSLGTQTNEM